MMVCETDIHWLTRKPSPLASPFHHLRMVVQDMADTLVLGL